MLYIKKEQSERYSGNGFSGIDYLVKDKDIDFAVIKVSGRSPDRGFQVNTECKELLYIISGNGLIHLKEENITREFVKGDVILINKNECYSFEGEFEASVSCSPSWTSEQHKYID